MGSFDIVRVPERFGSRHVRGGFNRRRVGRAVGAVSVGILRNVRLDLRLTMAIGFTYVVACALISVLYVAALFSVNLVFQSNPLAISWAGSLVAVLPVVVLLGPLLHQVRRFADYWICRRRYEYLRALKVFNRYAKDISDLRLLALAVEQAITLGTGAEDVRLLVPTENGVWFTAVSDRIFNSSPPFSSPPFQLHASSPIVTWLRFHDDALKKEELLGEPRYLPLSEKERAALESSRIQLFVPLKHREDLAGILALAGKRSEEPYSERDRSLLRTTTNQAAMWVSNARMFASVSSQRSRLENLLERAVQTQENERKRLAMELHDSPVQWLTSAVYHLEACLESFRRGEKRMTGRELQEVQETLALIPNPPKDGV